MIIKIASILLLLTSWVTSQGVINADCQMCMTIAARSRKLGNETEDQTKQRVLAEANSYSVEDQPKYTGETQCHWRKYYYDANFNPMSTLLETCADTGFCPIMFQKTPFQAVDITNLTDRYFTSCTNPTSIVIHHTVTPTVEDTIDTLVNRGVSVQYIVAKNGTIYQMVRDWQGAYHAGVSKWRNLKNLNTKSVGIENVNDGASPFTQAQITSLILLVKTLKQRWFVEDGNVVGHMDIAPDRKDDPSGYFSWQQLNDGVDVFPGLFNSSLTDVQKQQVLMSNSTWDPLTLTRVQNGLTSYGYTMVNMTAGAMDVNTQLNIQSFNRHYCPEVFIKEVENVTASTNIPNPLNQQWYGISDERLNYLLNHM